LLGLVKPNLVTVHDLLTEGDVVTLVLDPVHGGSLRDRLDASGTLLPKEIARIAAGVAAALHALHCVGVVHGDVRPETVLMDDSGSVRVPKLTRAGLFRIVPKDRRYRCGKRRSTSPRKSWAVASRPMRRTSMRSG
jgi:serine/threonine protein kinase